MRIAIITESFLPRINGVTNSVCQILRYFSDRGHQALVVAPGPAPDTYAGHRVVAVGGIALPGYRSFVVGLPAGRLDGLLADFRPDVVHLASPFALGAAGVAAARRLGLPTVAVFQTDIAGFARRYGFRGTDRAIWAWLRRVHRHADLTLAPSSATMHQLQEHGFTRLVMWRRGVDTDLFHPRHRDERLRQTLTGGRKVLVGYVGRISGDKRVHLLAGIADLPSVRLVVVGEGPAARRLTARLPQAHFLGLLRGAALSRAYASLDVFVHTGADETFCQAVQEAMSSGVAVVAPSAGGPLDLVEDGRTGLFYPPDSVPALHGAVTRLAGDPDLRSTFGRRGREAVQGRTWSAIGTELVGHYTRVVHGRADEHRVTA